FTAPANKQNSKQTTILWNANIKHYLTPFGYTINLHGYIKTAQQNYLITLNNHFNKSHYFPGIGADIINLPFKFGDTRFTSTIKARLWQQPEQFSFTSASSSIGGSLSTQVEYQWTQKFGTYFQFSYKTPGWLEGNAYLNSNTAIILGLRIRA
ncbi:MAG: hypothetical protein OEX07_10025, partial [Gammaproteobacteria bacterium]|nr:hypothetical protein [Gammaproteobacteria bacterium]